MSQSHPHAAALSSLDAAHRRIREVRRALVQLSSTLPHNALHPGHDAIVLTPQDSDNQPTGRRSPGSTLHMDAFRQASRDQRLAHLEQLQARWHLRRNTLVQALPERDNAQTTLGRRVAARQRQAAAVATDPPHQRPHSEQPQHRNNLTADIARDIEELTHRLIPLTQHLYSATNRPADPDTSSDMPDNVGISPANRVLDYLSALEQDDELPSTGQLEQRDHSRSLNTPQHRSSPSNIIQNPPNSSSDFPSPRPLIFDESTTTSHEDPMTADQLERRSYVVRRRFVNGEEVVHTIPEDTSWEPPTSNQRQQTLQPRPEPAYRPLSTSTVRRRPVTVLGQAEQPALRIPGLDPDGNELPIDEAVDDDAPAYELHIRIRRHANSSQQRSRSTSAIAPQAVQSGSQNSSALNSLRTHLPPEAQANLVESLTSLFASLDTPSYEDSEELDASFGSAAPFVVSPLPMPIQDMITTTVEPKYRSRSPHIPISHPHIAVVGR